MDSVSAVGEILKTAFMDSANAVGSLSCLNR